MSDYGPHKPVPQHVVRTRGTVGPKTFDPAQYPNWRQQVADSVYPGAVPDPKSAYNHR